MVLKPCRYQNNKSIFNELTNFDCILKIVDPFTKGCYNVVNCYTPLQEFTFFTDHKIYTSSIFCPYQTLELEIEGKVDQLRVLVRYYVARRRKYLYEKGMKGFLHGNIWYHKGCIVPCYQK